VKNMDVMTMAMAKPKRIELRDYAFDNGVSLEQVILLAYRNGGGRVDAPLDNKFWSDIDTNRPLRFITYTDLAGAKGGAIEIDGCTVLRMNGVPVQVSYECIFNFTYYARLRITIVRDASNNSAVAVSVEPIAWPDLTE
jgi:hypothetical protein